MPLIGTIRRRRARFVRMCLRWRWWIAEISSILNFSILKFRISDLPVQGAVPRPIGLERVLDLENLTLKCPGTLTGAVLGLKIAWR